MKKYEYELGVSLIKHLEDLKCMNQIEGFWFHVPNQISRNDNPKFGAALKRLGKVKGAPDYVFVWKNKVGFMELKRAKTKENARGTLQKEQRDLQTESLKLDVPFEVCDSLDDCLLILEKWGFIK